ncbi:hypothetical protein D9Q98_010409 [Chlorella vulgaris]|uniref:Uncharacterized protein n=1 Tax=Chlorella vulgaris TaxID=3077 RepID=A0A9D4TS87_CHLVU|nr:hypothetical protein D9Q98_010409 [Chlorella vulgaris]
MLDAATLARIHGLVTKGGPLAVVSKLAEGRKRSDLLFPPDWVKQRLAGDKADPPSKYCNAMISDKYKLIYLKCPKTASTSVLDGYFSNCVVPKRYDYCLHMVDYTNITDVKHLLSMWDEYFVFGFSRNVLRRAVSQYHYLARFVKEECGRMSWDTYCRDPYLIGDICAKQDANGESCCTHGLEHQYLHVSPQVNCLLTEQGKMAVDWIGRVEHFEDDFVKLISILNARPGVPSLPAVQPRKANYNASPCDAHRRMLRWQLWNGTENPCDKMELYQGQHAHCLSSITKFYADDLALLF